MLQPDVIYVIRKSVKFFTRLRYSTRKSVDYAMERPILLFHDGSSLTGGFAPCYGPMTTF